MSPMRAAKPCMYPGCPNLVRDGGGRCEVHRREGGRLYDERRGTAAQRGYDARWRKVRRMVLRARPVCADPFGYHAADGQVILATEVHHILPLSMGGTDEEKNLDVLCKACHSKITSMSKGGGGEISGTPLYETVRVVLNARSQVMKGGECG
ncbi:MAG: HNH endonuclease [Anaerolineaceae bacterium]|nr:HNH endonuclease [Anaerolineaceae bacterium]